MTIISTINKLGGALTYPRVYLCRTVFNVQLREKIYKRHFFFLNHRRILHKKKPNHKICSYAKMGYGLDTLKVIRSSEIQDKTKNLVDFRIPAEGHRIRSTL